LKADQAKWKLKNDEVASAQKIIENASKEQIGTHQTEPFYQAKAIPLPDIEGFTAIAFALPEPLRKFGGRIRELVADSACKIYFLLVQKQSTHQN
jgi:hypothetical protein